MNLKITLHFLFCIYLYLKYPYAGYIWHKTLHFDCIFGSEIKEKIIKKEISPTGNRTPVSRVTGGDTNHYTIEEFLLVISKYMTSINTINSYIIISIKYILNAYIIVQNI